MLLLKFPVQTLKLLLILRNILVAAEVLHSVVGKIKRLADICKFDNRLWSSIVFGRSVPQKEDSCPELLLVFIRCGCVPDSFHSLVVPLSISFKLVII